MVATKSPLGARTISGLVIGLIAMVLAGCTSNETFRYRMTVEVETPEGLRTGSSVREVEIWERMDEAIIGNKVGGKVRGEAVAVDLPNGKTLYMLLRNGRWLAHQAIKTPPPGKGHHDWGVKRARWMVENKAKGELPRKKYPMLVTFEDESDPTSVMEVDRDDLEATFGAGYRLKRVRVEITDDPVTDGLEKRLAWLPEFYDKQLSGDRYQDINNKDKGLSAFMSAGAFSAGVGVKSKRGHK